MDWFDNWETKHRIFPYIIVHKKYIYSNFQKNWKIWKQAEKQNNEYPYIIKTKK